ncbi:hypothetical protein Zmor_022869 [Zophobas morio]|uniref:Uncharacterized protein n=1 Tax=Zophobas morio TaxID=2755281 RepID=A0AA38M709_9CUCU|nr:hypothetical protein Zmor_022869 [Zophobas morio]
MGCRKSKPTQRTQSDVVIIFRQHNEVIIKDKRTRRKAQKIVLFLPVIVVTDENNTERIIYSPEADEEDMKRYIFKSRRIYPAPNF